MILFFVVFVFLFFLYLGVFFGCFFWFFFFFGEDARFGYFLLSVHAGLSILRSVRYTVQPNFLSS